jgi:hypothetical protein
MTMRLVPDPTALIGVNATADAASASRAAWALNNVAACAGQQGGRGKGVRQSCVTAAHEQQKA